MCPSHEYMQTGSSDKTTKAYEYGNLAPLGFGSSKYRGAETVPLYFRKEKKEEPLPRSMNKNHYSDQ